MVVYLLYVVLHFHTIFPVIMFICNFCLCILVTTLLYLQIFSAIFFSFSIVILLRDFWECETSLLAYLIHASDLLFLCLFWAYQTCKPSLFFFFFNLPVEALALNLRF